MFDFWLRKTGVANRVESGPGARVIDISYSTPSKSRAEDQLFATSRRDSFNVLAKWGACLIWKVPVMPISA